MPRENSPQITKPLSAIQVLAEASLLTMLEKNNTHYNEGYADKNGGGLVIPAVGNTYSLYFQLSAIFHHPNQLTA